MSVQNKPDYKIFADGAKPGEVVVFPDVLRGWGVTLDTTGGIPPMEFMNGIMKRLNEWLMYLTQRGIPEWDTSVDYPKSAVVSHNDIIYVSLKATKGENPGLTQQSWSTLKSALGVDGMVSKNDIVQITGSATNKVPSQKLFTDAITNRVKVDDFNSAMDGKVDTTSLVSTTGQSTTRVIHQKGITDLISNYATNSKVDGINETIGGVGQLWSDVTNSRNNETNYTNNTKKPIVVMVYGGVTDQVAVVSVDIFVNGVAAFKAAVGGSGVTKRVCGCAIVPPGAIYRVVVQNSTIGQWCELRG